MKSPLPPYPNEHEKSKMFMLVECVFEKKFRLCENFW